MPFVAVASPALSAPAGPHVAFLVLLPAIRAHARAAFRSLRSEHDREDAEAEVVARAWERFVAAPVAVTADRLVAPAVAAVRSELLRAHC